MSVGARARIRSTVAAMPAGSLGADHHVSAGRQATTKSALAMSIPPKVVATVIGPSTSQDPSRPGLADAGSRPHATVRAHDETPTTPTLSFGLGDRRKQRAVAGGWTSYEIDRPKRRYKEVLALAK